MLLEFIYANRLTATTQASNTEQVLEAAPHKIAAVRPLTTHHENY